MLTKAPWAESELLGPAHQRACAFNRETKLPPSRLFRNRDNQSFQPKKVRKETRSDCQTDRTRSDQISSSKELQQQQLQQQQQQQLHQREAACMFPRWRIWTSWRSCGRPPATAAAAALFGQTCSRGHSSRRHTVSGSKGSSTCWLLSVLPLLHHAPSSGHSSRSQCPAALGWRRQIHMDFCADRPAQQHYHHHHHHEPAQHTTTTSSELPHPAQRQLCSCWARPSRQPVAAASSAAQSGAASALAVCQGHDDTTTSNSTSASQ